MTRQQLLSSKWMRFVIFAWLVLFPLFFIAFPVADAVNAQLEMNFENFKKPIYGFAVWILGPWAGSIVLKYTIAGDAARKDEERSTEHE